MKLGVEDELCSLSTKLQLSAFTWTLPTSLVDITSHIPGSRVVVPTIPREEASRLPVSLNHIQIILFWGSICLFYSESCSDCLSDIPASEKRAADSHNNQASLICSETPSPRLRLSLPSPRASCSAASVPRRLLLPIKQPQHKLIWKQQCRNLVISSCATWKCSSLFSPIPSSLPLHPPFILNFSFSSPPHHNPIGPIVLPRTQRP